MLQPNLGANGLHPPATLIPIGGGAVRTPSEIAQLAQGLPLDILMQLRGVAAAVARLPPGQRPGAVPASAADPA